MQTRAVESCASDYIANLASLSRSGYSPTIGVGFLLADAVNTVARQFPNSRFAIIDYLSRPAVHGRVEGRHDAERPRPDVQHEREQLHDRLPRSLMARRAGGNTISAVGGLNIPTVSIFIAAYRAGAAASGAQVLIAFSQDFVAQDKCKEIALNQIAAGRVVSRWPAAAASAHSTRRERGAWGIGVDKDQSNLGRHILTSAVKRVDTSVFPHFGRRRPAAASTRSSTSRTAAWRSAGSASRRRSSRR